MDKLGYVTVCGGGECLIIIPSAAQSIMSTVLQLGQGAVAIRGEMRPDRLYHVCDEQIEAALAATPVPYTFAANRAEIKGSKGTIRDGSTAGLNDLQILHLRTSHSSKRTFLAGLKVNAFRGAQTTYATCVGLEIGPCEGCFLGNMRADSIPVSRRTYSKHTPMQEVGIDPVLLSTTTIDGGTVVNMGIDCVTKLMFAYEARTDGQQVVTMKKIERDWCEPYGHKIKVVHTDYASYFVNCTAFQDYCLEKKILHDASAPYNHAHNMVEGACVKIVMNRARVLLSDAGLPPSFAVYAIRTACTSWNALLHPMTATKTPYEQVTGQQPDVSDLRPFGALVYYKLTDPERAVSSDPRFREKALKGICLGGAPHVEGGYYVYPKGNRKPIVRKQVLVVEARAALMLPVFSDRFQIGDALSPREITIPQEDRRAAEAPSPTATRSVTRAAATAKENAELKAVSNSTQTSSSNRPITRATAGIGSRREAVALACKTLSADETSALAAHDDLLASTLPPVPRSMKEALRSPEWTIALAKERDDTLAGDSYEEITFRPERFMNAVIAYRVSRQADGSLKHRARLCPDGGKQVQGEDYDESFSPTVRKETIFLVLHLAGAQDWD
jgi:hypothetical protein